MRIIVAPHSAGCAGVNAVLPVLPSPPAVTDDAAFAMAVYSPGHWTLVVVKASSLTSYDSNAVHGRSKMVAKSGWRDWRQTERLAVAPYEHLHQLKISRRPLLQDRAGNDCGPMVAATALALACGIADDAMDAFFAGSRVTRGSRLGLQGCFTHLIDAVEIRRPSLPDARCDVALRILRFGWSRAAGLRATSGGWRAWWCRMMDAFQRPLSRCDRWRTISESGVLPDIEKLLTHPEMYIEAADERPEAASSDDDDA